MLPLAEEGDGQAAGVIVLAASAALALVLYRHPATE